MMTTFIAYFLFMLEWLHIWGHCLIFFRIRLLPRKDLVRIRLYFLVELLTVFCSSILLMGKVRWLAVLQIAVHLYYYVFWEKTSFAKRIVNWGSLDWLQSDLSTQWQIDSFLGIMFDLGVHMLMAYHLVEYLTAVQVVTALVIVQAGVLVIMFGPYYAWASPNNIPPWIQKRIHVDKLK